MISTQTPVQTPVEAWLKENGCPDWPWDSDKPFAVGDHGARHHMIPWKRLVRFGWETYTQRADLSAFLKSLSGIDTARIGSYANKPLDKLAEDFLAQQNEAQQEVSALFCWLRGNLVIGPRAAERNKSPDPDFKDPGEEFDRVAWNIRKQVVTDGAQYNNMFNDWNAGGNSKKAVFEMLATTNMPNPQSTRSNNDAAWKPPNNNQQQGP